MGEKREGITVQKQLRARIRASAVGTGVGLAGITEGVTITNRTATSTGVAGRDGTEIAVVVAIDGGTAAARGVAGIRRAGIRVGGTIKDGATGGGIAGVHRAHVTIGRAVVGTEDALGRLALRVERTNVVAAAAVEIIRPSISATTVAELLIGMVAR